MLISPEDQDPARADHSFDFGAVQLVLIAYLFVE